MPIFEPGRGRLDRRQFFDRFTEICQEHMDDERARAFAFIFYNFDDEDMQSILADEQAVATLNRIAANDITIFYLDTPSQKGLEFFNSTYSGRLNIQGEATPPCIVFFKVKRGHVTNVIPRHLDNADLINGLAELSNILTRYKKRQLRDRVTFQELVTTLREMFARFPKRRGRGLSARKVTNGRG